MSGCRSTWGETMRAVEQAWRERVVRGVLRPALLSAMLLTGLIAPLAQAGVGISTAHAMGAQGRPSGGMPHHVDPTAGTKSLIHLPPAAHLPTFAPLVQRPDMARSFQPTMRQGVLPLDPSAAAHFVGSDGRLEVDVPAGAVSASDVAAAGGQLSLQISEIAPPSGSNAGGSGLVSLGTYAIEPLNAKGTPVALGLRQPVTLVLHYATKETALDLRHAFVVVNGARPAGLGGAGPASSLPATDDPQAHTLRAVLPATGSATHAAGAAMLPALTRPLQQTPLTSFSFNTNAPVAKFGSPDPFNVDLNAGSLTEGVPIDVPPGPAGAMPNITLAYNSAAVSEQHNPQGAAGWVGEGWSLGLGAITWAEHDQYPTCPNAQCGNTWQSQWMLTDPFGASTELIPPTTTTSTYYDDSNNWYCTTGNAAATACPIQFHTARETHAKVYAYVGPNTLGGAPDHPPCFRVYLANGVMEEFGCTSDSIQYYPIPSGSVPNQSNANIYYPIAWLLDLITNPQGDQVHLTYQSDYETAPDGLNYTRDVALATVEWDAPDCISATQACASASWHPHYRVQFSATHHTVTRLTNTPSNCNPSGSLRCDDPLSIGGGIAAPLVNGTLVLNDIAVQSNTSGNGPNYNGATWNTVRDYQLSYEQSGPTTTTDPATGKQLSTAGYLDLTQIKEVGADGATAYPATTFGYTSQTEYYEDGSFTPSSTMACGPSWNTGGNGGGCALWSESRDGNSRYLAAVSNGQGLAQTFTWANARNNTHGVNSGQGPDIANPLYCDGKESQGYPCNEADDQDWSRIVVTGRADSVVQLTQAGQGGQQTSTPVTSSYVYTYQLSYPLAAQECGDCVAGMYWGNELDGDYLDYYHGTFMGFAEVAVSNPDGSVVTHHYEATQGWGVYDTNQGLSCATSTLPPITTSCAAAPWWNIANAGHGLETETDYSDTNGTTLLKKVTAQYQAVCPPSGVGGTPPTSYGTWDGKLVSELDPQNPVAVCDVQQTQQVTTTLDGSGTSASDTESYSYDSYGRLTQTTSTTNGGGTSPTSIIHKTTYVWNDGLSVPAAQRTNTNQEGAWGGFYLLDVVASTDTENGGGTQYACQRSNYDGQGYLTGQTSALTKANATEQDQFATSCGANPSGALKTTTGFDGFGNTSTTKDADANNGDPAHTAGSGPCANATSCTQYSGVTRANPTLTGNAQGQTMASVYATDASGGFGLWLTSSTDANGQTTTYGYDALGRMTSLRAPGQSSGPATQSHVYTTWCAGTSAQSPCVEVDTTQRLDSATTVTSRQFYDGAGRLVETRTAAPGGQDVVAYTLYNAAGAAAAASVRYFVAAYTGAPGSAAYSILDSAQAVTSTSYDGLGRTLGVTDALSNATRMGYSVVCAAPGTYGDTGCYAQTLVTDANGHQSGTLTDGFGRTVYAQQYSGNGAPYTLYRTTRQTYDYNGRVTQVLQPDGTSTSTATYDTAGRLTAASDPDRGSVTYGYDGNGNLTQQSDARGASGTVYTGYDGLDRPIWRNTTNTGSGAYVTYSYDGTANGSDGLGRLTSEVFRGSAGTGPTSFSGAYTYTYDALGRATQTVQTMGVAGVCPDTWSCQDVGSPSLAGSQSYTGNGIWTISGGGSDIYGTSDQFHFVSQVLTGDGTLTAHVESQTESDSVAKAGLMVRGGTAANAPFYDVLVTPGGTVYVEYRDSAGGSVGLQASVAAAPPVWVALARSGTTYRAMVSTDGTHYTLIANSERTMSNLGGSVPAGVAVSSHNTGAVSLVTVDSLSTTTGGTGVCPSGGWTCQDIGSPALAGSQSALGNNEWSVAGGGTAIWGTSDQFHLVSQALSGDGSISARMESQSNTSGAAQAGVMLRLGTAANAPYYDAIMTPGSGLYVEDRASAGGGAVLVKQMSAAFPIYVQVTRTGTTFSTATSPDGVTWTPVSGSSVTLSNLSGTLQAGVANDANNAGAVSTAVVDRVSLGSGGTTFTAPSSVTTTAVGTPSGVTSYAVGQGYDDAGLPTTTSYPDGETVSTSYTAEGWLAGLSSTLNGTTTTLLANTSYSGAGGANGQWTGATLGNGVYTAAVSFDALARPTETKLTRTSGGALLFDQSRTYDAVGNVASASTTLPGGTDAQAFCYDAQNRLTWASSQSGSVPCGGTLSAGTLTSAGYTNTYSYDTLDRLTSGPLGAYSYGASGHLHAVTAIGAAYTARYDAAGNMTCRAPTSSTTCSGTPTGAQLTYDNEGRLAAWQNAPTNPSSTTSNLYDGAGNRVEQQVVSGGTSTTTVYVGNAEEISTSAGATITTTSYYAGGQRLAQAVNGVFSYLGSDGLGSALVALDGSGNAQASILYDPYGNVRYSNGAMPGSDGFTGQHADGATGLDDYNARYYDSVAGQFTSADSVAAGLNRYGYVAGNPESYTDPSGHIRVSGDGGALVDTSKSGSGSGGSGTTTTSTHSGGCGGCTPSSLAPHSGPTNCFSLSCASVLPGPVTPMTPCGGTPVWCAWGNDPNGLFSLISGEVGGDITHLVGAGVAGLSFLLDELNHLEAAIGAYFNNFAVGMGLGAAGAFGLAITPCSIFCLAIGSFAVAVGGLQVAYEGQLTSMIGAITGKIQGILNNVTNTRDAWAKSAYFIVSEDNPTNSISDIPGFIPTWAFYDLSVQTIVP